MISLGISYIWIELIILLCILNIVYFIIHKSVDWYFVFQYKGKRERKERLKKILLEKYKLEKID